MAEAKYTVLTPHDLTKAKREALTAALKTLCETMDSCGVKELTGKESKSPDKGVSYSDIIVKSGQSK